MSTIEAFVTNLGKYNEGELVGEWLKLPAETKDVQALLQRIGVDGRRYEEIFITDYNTEIDGLYDHLSEYASLDELNYLAALLDDLDKGELATFEAAITYGDHTGSLKELINLSQNLDCYELYPDVCDDDDLGRYMIDEMGTMEIPEYLENYIDYEAYGRDVSLEDNGTFTDNGYVVNNGDRFVEQYDGREIPEEYRVFAYPQEERPSILETIKRFQKAKNDTSVPSAEKRKPTVAHEER